MSNKITATARKLRKNSTKTENLLWRRLRNRQLAGFKFRRQQPVGSYIVDFINFEKKIVIEIDGGQHAKFKNKDKKRNEWLYKEGFEVMRFWNNEVFENLDSILEVIRDKLITPFHQGRGNRAES